MRRASLLALALLASACRSPFATRSEPLEGPGAWKVGEGIHGWPLFERDFEGAGWRTDVLWPAASVRTDAEGSIRQADFLFPFFFYEKAATRMRIGARPLFAFAKEPPPEAGKDGTVDLDLPWPFVNWRSGPRGSRFALRPLFFSGRRDAKSWTVLFPFFWNLREGDSSKFHLWPIYGIDRDGEARRHSVLFPLFTHARDPSTDRVSWNALGPLARYRREGRDARGWFFPFYFAEAREGFRSTTVFPFYWRRESEDASWLHLWPAYGRHRDGSGTLRYVASGLATRFEDPSRDLHGWNLLWGGVHWRRSNEGTLAWAFPLLYAWSGGGASFATILPLVWSVRGPESAFFLAFPFYAKKTEGSSRKDWLLFPFFARTRDPARDLVAWDAFAPLFRYEASADGTTIRAIPFLWHRFSGPERRTVVFPLWWNFEDADSGFATLFPFYGRQWKGTRFARTFVAGPLYVATRDGETRSTDVLWPLGNRTTGPDRSHVRALPFVWHDRRGGERETVAFPLWWDFERGDRRVSVLFPLYVREREADRYERSIVGGPLFVTTRRGDERSVDVLWPFVRGSTRPGGSHFRVLPLFWRTRAPEGKTTVVFPFWWDRESGDASLRWAFPFYGTERRGADFERTIVGPGVVVATRDGASRSIDVLWPLANWSRGPGESRARIFPVWWAHESAESSYRVAFPFYGKERRGEDFERTTYGPGLVVRTRDGGVRSTSVLWPLGKWSEGADESHARLLPFFWKSRTPGKRTTVAFPLWWDFRSGERETRVLFPLFVDARKDDAHRRTMVAGSLVVSTRDGDERATSVLWPFVKWTGRGDGWSFRAFPILFLDRGASPEGPTASSTIFPVFHAERTGERRSGSLVWPLVRWEREAEGRHHYQVLWKLLVSRATEHKTTFALNPVFEHERNDRGDVHWSALFDLVARTREADTTTWRFLWFLRV